MTKLITVTDGDTEAPAEGAAGAGPERQSQKQVSPQTKARLVKNALKNNIFFALLLVGILSGVTMGVALRKYQPNFGKDARKLMYLAFPGKLLLRMLKGCIIPLIVTSLISGMASIPTRSAGRLGGYTIIYYLSTTFSAVILGILLVSGIRPGKEALDETVRVPKDKLVEPADAFLDLIR